MKQWRKALREMGRDCLGLSPALFDCSFQIRLDLAPKAAALTHKFTISIFALPTRTGSGWQNSGSRALRECGKRKSDTEKGFIFSVQQLSDWQILLTFLAWEGKAS